MKKYCLTAVFIFGVLFQSYAQARPFIGYDQVAWGASPEDVRRAYNLGDDLVPSNSGDPNIAVLVQLNPSQSIERREFMFNKWKTSSYQLYRVYVVYRNGSDANHDAIRDLLEQRYGRQTGIEFQSTGTQYDTITVFGRFAPDIEVQLFKRRTQRLSGTIYSYTEESVLVYYTWKGFRDEYQASLLGL